MIWFNGFPFLDNKEEHTFGVPVSHVMNQELTVLPSTGMTLQAVGMFNLCLLGKSSLDIYVLGGQSKYSQPQSSRGSQ